VTTNVRLVAPQLRFTSTAKIPSVHRSSAGAMVQLYEHLKKSLKSHNVKTTPDSNILIDSVRFILVQYQKPSQPPAGVWEGIKICSVP